MAASAADGHEEGHDAAAGDAGSDAPPGDGEDRPVQEGGEDPVQAGGGRGKIPSKLREGGGPILNIECPLSHEPPFQAAYWDVVGSNGDITDHIFSHNFILCIIMTSGVGRDQFKAKYPLNGG